MSDPHPDPHDFTPEMDTEITTQKQAPVITDKQRIDSLELRVAYLESRLGNIDNFIRKLTEEKGNEKW